MAIQMQALEKFIAASEATLAAQMLGTYAALKKEFELVNSRRKKTQAYHDLIDHFCQQQADAADGARRKSDVAKFNVGGKVFIIKKCTVSSDGSNMNFLSLILSGRWNYLLPMDRNKVVFIDLDPALIEPVTDTLRSNFDSDTISMPRISIDKAASFKSILLYYNLRHLLYASMPLSEESKIELMNDENSVSTLQSFLPSDLLLSGLTLNLLYRQSRDKSAAASLHTKCDGKCNTVTIIKDSAGNVFGGFNDTAWSRSNVNVSEKSFLFSLKSSTGKEPLKFPAKGTSNAYHDSQMYGYSSSSCPFGSDLGIQNNYGNSINIGTSYVNLPGLSPHYCTGGQHQFTINEMEVYEVIMETVRCQTEKVYQETPRAAATVQSVSAAVLQSNVISGIYTSETRDIASQLLEMATSTQLAEEQLLIELLWIEHLSMSTQKRNLPIGLLADWQRIYKASADVLPLSNGIVVTSCGSKTLKRVEEAMARLQIKLNINANVKNNNSNPSKSMVTRKVDVAADVVISFNVGGTIIAVLRSTLLRQAPNCTFNVRFSDRWTQQSDELDECGNIYMVGDIVLSLYIHPFISQHSFTLLPDFR